MFLEKKINELIDNKKTVNVTLIGAGKFGSMFLSQAPYTKGLNVFTICDLNIDKAKNYLKSMKPQISLRTPQYFENTVFGMHCTLKKARKFTNL